MSSSSLTRSRTSFSNNGSKPPQKLIYVEDELFAGKTENGFYLFHSTLDPSEKYKQKRIGTLSEKPEKQFIEETIRYGQMGEKLKYRLNKEKLKEWIEEEYGFIFTDKPSPWAPKKLGSTTIKGNSNNSDTDEDSDTSERPTKFRKTPEADESEVLTLLKDIKSLIENNFISTQEVAANLRTISGALEASCPGSPRNK